MSKWLLNFLGLALLLGGAGAMVFGWDQIQIERGWSLFIAGAVGLSGGAVVLALAQVLGRLDAAVLLWGQSQLQRQDSPSATRQQRPPRVIDRYDADDATYVMFSDGSVELRSADGVRYFASLAEMRAEAVQPNAADS